MPASTCERCRHFTPDPINPPAGMGACTRVHGHWHPMAPHFCREREEVPDAAA